MAGQVLLIFLEGAVSYPAFAALPPRDAFGWVSLAGGVVLLAAAASIVYRGIDDLGSNLTAFPAPRPEAELVETGIYSRVRHPIYAGVIGVAVGWAFFVVSLPALVVALLLAAWLDLKSRREEVWCVAHHPGYDAYQRRTARFVPGLY
ncbi:MAG TPA: isoprenylcysteine carboxylmethyltransferase family protein [Candidatus Limnocylindria bacterium]